MENKTHNKYRYPVDLTEDIRMTYDESPAHVGDIKDSVDFICKEGTPVKAARNGVVFKIKSDSNIGGPGKELEEFGNYIEIKHENEEVSEYEHLKKDSVLVKVGEKIKEGQLIAYSGATGWLAHLGPHLHFMIGKYEEDNVYRTMKITWKE